MSYILDALKKAEAEREKGQIPGLRSQIDAASPHSPVAASAVAKPWLALAVVGLLLAAAGLGWWLRPAATPAGAVGPMVSAAPALAPTLAPSVGLGGASSPAPVLPAAPLLPLQAVHSAPAKPVAENRPKPIKSNGAASAPAERVERVLRWSALTATQREQLPKLHWGGAMYSPDPKARMVIVNDQVKREGESLASGLVLERIEAKSAVLNHNGQRIRWDF